MTARAIFDSEEDKHLLDEIEKGSIRINKQVSNIFPLFEVGYYWQVKGIDELVQRSTAHIDRVEGKLDQTADAFGSSNVEAASALRNSGGGVLWLYLIILAQILIFFFLLSYGLS